MIDQAIVQLNTLAIQAAGQTVWADLQRSPSFGKSAPASRPLAVRSLNSKKGSD